VAVLEASASALPVIATAHAGIKDTVVHEQTGLLCAETDVNAMARHMLAVLKEPTLARDLGQNGRRRVVDLFSMDKSIAKLSDVLSSAAR
jgi:glycosyltransferase involved in cell wall biosynthesis